MTGPDEHPADEPSVLSSLPGTRPQRRSPKRPVAAGPTADEAAKADEKADESAPARTTPPSQRRPRPPRARRPPGRSAASEQAEPPPRSLTPDPPVDPVSDGRQADPDASRGPRQPSTPPVAAQGFEADPIHGSVNPPTAAELLASVAQAATELVGIGLDLTRRVARSVFDRLPRL